MSGDKKSSQEPTVWFLFAQLTCAASLRVTAMDDTPVQCPIINQNLRFVLTCCYAGIVVAKDIVAHFSLILIKPAETKVVPFVKCFIWAIPR